MKNLLQYASNCLGRPTSITSSVYATPIDHIYCRSCVLCSCAQLAKYKQAKVVNIIIIIPSLIDADAVRRVCALESSSFLLLLITPSNHTQQSIVCFLLMCTNWWVKVVNEFVPLMLPVARTLRYISVDAAHRVYALESSSSP